MIIKDVVDAKILVELGEQLSFAGAARRLGVPPATLSRRVAEMERVAGLRLFERTTRAVTVTEAGEIAIEHAARILVEVDGVQRCLEERHRTPGGRVRLTAPVILGQQLLGPIVAGFLDTYPDCDVTLDLSNRQADLVEDRFDFAIRVGPPGERDLIAQTVGTVAACLYRAPVGTRNEERDIRVPSDLDGCPAALFGRADKKNPVIELIHAKEGRATCHVDARLISMSPWVLGAAAVRGGLVAFLPKIVGEPFVSTGQLEQLLPGWGSRSSPVSIVFTSKKHLRPAARACIDHMASQLRAVLAD